MMKRTYTIILAFILVFATACKKDQKEDADASDDTGTEVQVNDQINEKPIEKILVQLEPKSDTNVNGNALFKQNGETVQLVVVLNNLTPGEHAIHIHEKADCSAPDGTSTGGHWNPAGQPHGKFGDSKGYHKGDIGNFTVNEDGKGTITFITQEWCIGCGDPNKDILGKAVIVHQGSDDFTTQPTGAAGGRVSCGGIIQ